MTIKVETGANVATIDKVRNFLLVYTIGVISIGRCASSHIIITAVSESLKSCSRFSNNLNIKPNTTPINAIKAHETSKLSIIVISI